MNTNPFQTLDNKLDLLLSRIDELSTLITPQQQPNLSVKEVAEILGVTKHSVRTYIHKGLLPAQRIGRKYLISKEDLDASILEHKSLKYLRN